ncbi:hypothetical protein [Kibdelosporangium aridum]|uniref:hypothetical protein n=1 Tax=Kibdelosporangium aridum TaxID=2030 RepID=UPI0035E7837D
MSRIRNLLAPAVLAVTAAATLGLGAAPAGASETATRVSEGLSGSVMTPEQMEVFACSKGGYNESIGWARCSGTHRFKVRVWCTWAGQGLSNAWRTPYNWAQCNRGSVREGSQNIEVIWA